MLALVYLSDDLSLAKVLQTYGARQVLIVVHVLEAEICPREGELLGMLSHDSHKLDRGCLNLDHHLMLHLLHRLCLNDLPHS